MQLPHCPFLFFHFSFFLCLSFLLLFHVRGKTALQDAKGGHAEKSGLHGAGGRPVFGRKCVPNAKFRARNQLGGGMWRFLRATSMLG